MPKIRLPLPRLRTQAQQWWNLATSITSANGDGEFQSGKSDVLTHGPFAKITVELPTR